jgi:hypothetical protein
MTRQFTRRVTWTLTIILLALVVMEAVFFPYDHPVFPWHPVPGYAAGIGLGASIVVVLLSKKLGAWLLQRPESDE